jgi:hypothetical protein
MNGIPSIGINIHKEGTERFGEKWRKKRMSSTALRAEKVIL